VFGLHLNQARDCICLWVGIDDRVVGRTLQDKVGVAVALSSALRGIEARGARVSALDVADSPEDDFPFYDVEGAVGERAKVS